jgi:hypothetical protein
VSKRRQLVALAIGGTLVLLLLIYALTGSTL